MISLSSFLLLLSCSMLVLVAQALVVVPHRPQASPLFTSRSCLFAAQISKTNANDLASFADLLDDDDDDDDNASTTRRPRRSKRTTTTKSSLSSSSPSERSKREWQVVLEDFLDPSTPVTKRQQLFSDLLSSNQDIQSSFQSALRERSIDPLLTPRGKRLREGSRAVARQLTSDILPELIPPPSRQLQSSLQQQQQKRQPGFLPPLPPLDALVPPPQDLEKVGSRVLNALQNQWQKNLEAMQSDIQNEPWRSIPQRLSQQSRDFLKEASNVFAETPAGLQEPPYTIGQQGVDYEIRQYDAYRVASTPIVAVVDENNNDVDNNNNKNSESSMNDPYSLAQNGAAFNTLAAYLFGANKDGVAMEMTTPVTTTMSGEMRFYLANRNAVIPEPLEQDESSTNEYWYGLDKPGKILIQDIPPARLAVRRFTGFCTKGEVMRQKNALLASLAMDGVELDVPHGATVPHVVFQYNPPYTLPVLRRNEIAVAVLPNPKDEDYREEEEEEEEEDDDNEDNGNTSFSP